jgi:hypothetical protein
MLPSSANLRKISSAVIEKVVPEPVRAGARIARNVLRPICFFAGVYALCTFGPAYSRKFQFDQDLRALALASAYNDESTSTIHDKIMQRGRELDLMVKDENVEVAREEDRVRINASYEMPVHLGGGKVVSFNFAPSCVEKVSSHAAVQVKSILEKK